jgi:hypothetical protein
MRTSVIVGSVLLASLAAGGVALRCQWIDVPPAWLPWKPLDVAATTNPLTRYKLARLSGDAEQCRAVLAATAVDFELLTDRATGEGCGLRDAVLVRGVPAAVGEPFPLTCRTAVSLALWDLHVVQPAARRLLGSPVVHIEHFGSYSCRNVYGRPQATRSRHATAEAWDVAGFVLADGRRIRLAHDWQGTQPQAAFLREVRDGACRFFDGVLSPDYNAAHHDHLHLDRGSYRMCR